MANLLITLTFIFILAMIILSTFFNFMTRYVLLNKYKNVLEIFEYFLAIAYKVIYDDQIVSFASSGLTVNQEQLENIQRNFIKLSYQIIGDTNLELFRKFFGSERSLITNINLYIRKRIVEDELAAFIDKQSKVLEEGR